MYRLRRGLSLSFFLVLFSASAVFAQEKATIVGTVTDPSGSVIPTAKVTVTNDGTGQVREIQTNSSGSFVVPDLSIGMDVLQHLHMYVVPGQGRIYLTGYD